MKDTVLFIDTSALLHFRRFDEVPWLELLGCKELTIIFPMIIHRELDKHKDTHPVRRIKERARSVVKKIEELSASGNPATLRPDIEVLFDGREPFAELQANRLDPNCPDDHLIASVFRVRQPPHNTGCRVVLTTDDSGMKHKARQYKIELLVMPEDMRLQEELDPVEVENKELKRQIQILENRIPKLRLCFEDSGTFMQFKTAKPLELTPILLMRHLSEELANHPKRFEIARLPSSLLDTFTDSYEAYFRKRLEYQTLCARAFPMALFISNEGKAKANDIRVFIEFPFRSEVWDEYTWKTEPKPPVVPSGELTADLFRNYTIAKARASVPAHQEMDVDRPQVLQHPERTEVSFKVADGILHGLKVSLRQIWFAFETFEAVGSFALDYSIHSADVPEATTGQLHLKIEKSLEGQSPPQERK